MPVPNRTDLPGPCEEVSNSSLRAGGGFPAVLGGSHDLRPLLRIEDLDPPLEVSPVFDNDGGRPEIAGQTTAFADGDLFCRVDIAVQPAKHFHFPDEGIGHNPTVKADRKAMVREFERAIDFPVDVEAFVAPYRASDCHVAPDDSDPQGSGGGRKAGDIGRVVQGRGSRGRRIICFAISPHGVKFFRTDSARNGSGSEEQRSWEPSLDRVRERRFRLLSNDNR